MKRLTIAIAVSLVAAACASSGTSNGSTTTTAGASSTTTASTTTATSTTTAATTTTTIPTGPVDVAVLQPLPLQLSTYTGDAAPESGYTMTLFTGSPLKAAIGAINGFPAGCLGIGLFSADYTMTYLNAYLPLSTDGCGGMVDQPHLTPIDLDKILGRTDHTIIVELGDLPPDPFIPAFQIEQPDGENGVYSRFVGDPILPGDVPNVDAPLGIVLGGDLFSLDGTWNAIRPPQPTPPPPPGNCVPSETVLCLARNRFQVQTDWRLPGTGAAGGGSSGTGTVLTSGDDTGTFWFFDQENWELLVKVINGCAINDHYWVFVSIPSGSAETTVEILDTTTSESKEYVNPLVTPAPAIEDTRAFSTCP